MDRIRRQRPFLQAIVSSANRNRRKDFIKHANKDQVNAISEIILNLLKKKNTGKVTTVQVDIASYWESIRIA